MRMKKRRNSKGKKTIEKDPSEISIFTNAVKNCDVGASPEINMRRKRNNQDS